MSGGDGKDGRGPTGGVNGGPTGFGGGPNVGHGGTLTDTINGVTMTFEGVHALDSGSGVHWGAIPAMAIKAEIIAVPLVLKTCKLFLAIPMLFLTG